MAADRSINTLFDFLDSSDAFTVICKSYAGKTAKRSGLPYLNHIIDGCLVIFRLRGLHGPIIPFCLHPVFQSDESLARIDINHPDLASISKEHILLCMEYRKTANAYSVNQPTRAAADISLSPLAAVNDMLIADKVQNKHDFMLHIRHQNDRPGYQKSTAKYEAYFDSWLAALGISTADYQKLTEHIKEQRQAIDAFVSTH